MKKKKPTIDIPDGSHVLGVDIGGTKMMAAVFDRNCTCLGRERKKVATKKGAIAPEVRLCKVIDAALKQAGKHINLVGIGVGSPGPLDPETGVIIDTPNLNWKDFPLGGLLEERYGVPVAVDNDVNVGTMGEWHFGELTDCQSVLGVFPGTGIGSGIIVNGQLLHGFSGAAGEIGHITLDIGGPFCGCGKRGCIEALASRIAIAREVAALAARGDAPYIAEHCGTDIKNIRSGALARAIKAGDTMVEDTIRQAAYYVGVGVANAINILSPEAVVLGGGLVEAMESLYLKEVRRAVKEHAMPFLRKNVKIVAAHLGDDAVVLGGAQLISQKL